MDDLDQRGTIMETEVIKWILLAVFGGVSWFMKRTIDQNDREVQNLKQTVQQIKEQYLHKDDFKEFKTELRGMFEELRLDIRNLQKHQ